MSLTRIVVILIVVGGIVAAFIFIPQIHDPVMNVLRGAQEEATEMTTPTNTIRGVAIKVYRARGDEYYHTRDCPRLAGASVQTLTLERARELYEPCPECNPPR